MPSSQYSPEVGVSRGDELPFGDGERHPSERMDRLTADYEITADILESDNLSHGCLSGRSGHEGAALLLREPVRHHRGHLQSYRDCLAIPET